MYFFKQWVHYSDVLTFKKSLGCPVKDGIEAVSYDSTHQLPALTLAHRLCTLAIYQVDYLYNPQEADEGRLHDLPYLSWCASSILAKPPAGLINRKDDYSVIDIINAPRNDGETNLSLCVKKRFL